MTNDDNLKKALQAIDKSDLNQTVDQCVAARLGKPADEEEE